MDELNLIYARKLIPLTSPAASEYMGKATFDRVCKGNQAHDFLLERVHDLLSSKAKKAR